MIGLAEENENLCILLLHAYYLKDINLFNNNIHQGSSSKLEIDMGHFAPKRITLITLIQWWNKELQEDDCKTSDATNMQSIQGHEQIKPTETRWIVSHDYLL